MSQQEDGSSKTEKPTPKRLREARKKGDVPKSKDVSSTASTLFWLLILAALGPIWSGQLTELVERTFRTMREPGVRTLTEVSVDAIQVLLVLGVAPLVVASLLGTLVEFLQVRGIFALEKVKPDLNHLNPVEGVKRMFNAENITELVKSILKTALLIGIFLVLMMNYMQDLVKSPLSSPSMIASLWWKISSVFVMWVLILFLFVAAMDAVFQHFNFMKKMRMTRRDVKREHREDEGDPYIKQRRKQMHQEWSQQNMLAGVRRSNVVVTNPTHLAVALLYEKGETVVPMVTAKGEDHLARLIRETAEQEGIPVMQNVDLARALHSQVDIDDFIPLELFEAVAQVLLWAKSVRDDEQREASEIPQQHGV
jgi:type III secretion protein U